jgi:hypothetical protein
MLDCEYSVLGSCELICLWLGYICQHFWTPSIVSSFRLIFQPQDSQLNTSHNGWKHLSCPPHISKETEDMMNSMTLVSDTPFSERCHCRTNTGPFKRTMVFSGVSNILNNSHRVVMYRDGVTCTGFHATCHWVSYKQTVSGPQYKRQRTPNNLSMRNTGFRGMPRHPQLFLSGLKKMERQG